jgi:DNA-binding SARP family transcriptional activator/predicted ATPase
MLKLDLLGRPLIYVDAQRLDALRLDKPRALLFYLAVTGQQHTREHLADLLWSERYDPKRTKNTPRDNLKKEIWRLNTFPELKPYILTERQHIRFNPELPLELDVRHFSQCFPARGEPTVDQLEEALKLYRGVFLDQFYVDEEGFDVWAQGQRVRLQEKALQAVGQLARYYAARQNFDHSLQYVEDWLQIEPDEVAHRCKLILLALKGQPERARAYYEYTKGSADFSDDVADLLDQIEQRTVIADLLDDLLPALPQSSASVPAVVTSPKPFQSPPRPDQLFGRDDDVTGMRSEIAAHQHTFYAIVGMGGIGKTSLAIRLAHELRHLFEDGVLWADLAESTPADILDIWGRAYGANDIGRLVGTANRATAFRNLMADKQALIVIDDVKKADQVEQLLPGHPGCIVLLTTRYQTVVTDIEIASRLRAKRFSLKGLARQASVALLTSVLGVERVQDEPEAANAIAELLGDLPLALEITAQQLAFTPDRMLSKEADELRRIDSRLKRLKIGNRAVRASFDRSWALLGEMADEGETLRRFFMLLGVFGERPYSLEAAAYVAELVEDEADSLIATLCGLSLVNREGRGRYRLHALLSDYAREKLGSNPRPYIRMAAYYQQYAARHKDQFGELDKEWGSVAAGMQAAYDFKHWPLLINYAEALKEALFGLGRFTDARQLYGWLCRDPARDDHNSEIVTLVGPQVLGDFYCQWALASIEQNEYESASFQVENGQEVYEELNDKAGIARTRYLLGRVRLEGNDYDAAYEALSLSREMYQEINDQLGAAEASHLIAQLHYDLSSFTESEQFSQQALLNFQEIGFQIGVIKSLRLLADLANKRQDYSSAETYCMDALAICDQINEQSERTVVLYSLAISQWLQEKLEPGLRSISESIELLSRIGDRKLQGRCYRIQASIYAAMHELDQAQRSCEKSLKLSHQVGDLGNYIMGLEVQSGIYAQLEQYNQALASCEEAHQLAVEFGNEGLIARIVNKKAEIQAIVSA